MAQERDDLTLEQLFADPLVRGVMRADHVDPVQLKSMLCRVAAARRDAAEGSAVVRDGDARKTALTPLLSFCGAGGPVSRLAYSMLPARPVTCCGSNARW